MSFVNKITSNNYAVFLIIVLAGLALYFPVLQYGMVDFDDNKYYFELLKHKNDSFLSQLLWPFSNIVLSNWHPLTVLSFVFDFNLYGLNVKNYHLTNIIIHIVNVFAVFLLFLKVSKNRAIAFIISFLFLVHPLNVESVAWLGERKGILSALFVFFSFYTYLLFRENGNKKNYYLSVFLFVLAVLSKATAVILPLLLILYELTEFNRRLYLKNIIKVVLDKWLYLIISLVIGLVTIYVHSHSGVLESEATYPFFERLQNAIYAYWVYITQFIYPDKLTVYYPPIKQSTLLVFGLAVLLCLSVYAAIKQKIQHKEYFFGWFWFLVVLLPVIGLIKSGHHGHADRYMYLAMPGLLYIVVSQTYKLYLKYKKIQPVLLFIFTMVFFILSVTSARQIKTWENVFTLFDHANKVTEKNNIAHVSLAYAYLQKGDIKKGMQHYAISQKIEPDLLVLYWAIAHELQKQKRTDLAINVLQQGLQAGVEQKRLLTKMVEWQINSGSYNDAIDAIKYALTLGISNQRINYLLAHAVYYSGDAVKAKKLLLELVKSKDISYQTVSLLLKIAIRSDNGEEAKTWLKILLLQYPDKLKKYGINTLDIDRGNEKNILRQYQLIMENKSK